jgi:hypothetical protein
VLGVGAGFAAGLDDGFAGVGAGASVLEGAGIEATGCGVAGGSGVDVGGIVVRLGTAGVSASRTGERSNVIRGRSSGGRARRRASATRAATGSIDGVGDGVAGGAGGAATRGAGTDGCDSRPKSSSRIEFPASAVVQKYPAAQAEAASASTRRISPGGTCPLSPTGVTT